MKIRNKQKGHHQRFLSVCSIFVFHLSFTFTPSNFEINIEKNINETSMFLWSTFFIIEMH